MDRGLGVLTGPKAEVDSQLDQVSDVAGLGVGGGNSRGHNGLYDAKGGDLLTLEGNISNSISFELTGKAPVQVGVSLVFRGISWVGGGI